MYCLARPKRLNHQMDIARLTSGRQKLRLRAVKQAITQAEQHVVTVTTSAKAVQVPQLAEGEEGRLQRVLVNGGIEEGKGL
jgi:hypothetical protein